MNKIEKTLNHFENNLDSFDSQVRKESLTALCELVDSGSIAIDPEKEIANLHCHSFFSYNGYGYSPSHLAWLGKKNGIKFMGIVDFDVLDGVDEFLVACASVGIRGTAGMETRVTLPEFRQVEMNSPGEPGICYHMGTGFTSSGVPSSVKSALDDIQSQAMQRNLHMLKKINQFLDPLYIDYEIDILPMTPSGTATERHMVQRIAEKAAEEMSNPCQYWSQKLHLPFEQIEQEMKDINNFNNLLRKKLMKQGSVGYTQPTTDSFPSIDEFNSIVTEVHALPCFAWLDGMSQGEKTIEALLDLHIFKGAAAINIIPDRSWNLKDPQDKEIKLQNLFKIVNLANQLDLPVLVGTEMNQYGQKMVDDFCAPELEPVNAAFIKGANFLYGHTQMQMRWGMGYQSDWAKQHFPDRKTKNIFFEAAGGLIPPGSLSDALDTIPLSALSPDAVLTELKKYKEF